MPKLITSTPAPPLPVRTIYHFPTQYPRVKSVRTTPLQKLSNLLKDHSLSEISRSTKIPASVLSRAKAGKIRLREASISRISRLETKVKAKRNYDLAREKGLSSKEASLIKNMNPERAKKYVGLRTGGVMRSHANILSLGDKDYITYMKWRYDQVARKLAKKHKVALKHIYRGMSYSIRTIDNWEEYVKTKKKG